MLRSLSLWVLPMSSGRRMIARTVQQVARAPMTAFSRFSATNVRNFFYFRGRAFDCSVCGQRSRPLYDFPDLARRREHRIGPLRETLQCRECYAPMRERSLALALLDQLAERNGKRHASIAALARSGLRGVRILDTDNFSALSRLLRDDPDYIRSSYLPDQPFGALVAAAYYNIDLERIDFTNGSFDIVLTSDVMEHVRDSAAAHREIYRILRPDGAYIFNVPFDETEEADVRLVDTSTSTDIYLVPPQYHGDPLTGGILAYRVFGRELVGELEALGFTVNFQRLDRPDSLVMDGDVFVATKTR